MRVEVENLNGGLNKSESGDLNDKLCLNPNNQTKFVKVMFLNISNITALQNNHSKNSASLTTLNRNALKMVKEMFKLFFQEYIGAGLRPSHIVMPVEGGTLVPLQETITNTRLGHRKQKKKQRLNYEVLAGREEDVAQSPRPNGGFKLQHQRKLMQKKCTKVKLWKLCREECANCDELNMHF